MKQSATRRNKKRNETQLARLRRPRSGFLRPLGLPDHIKSPRTQKVYDFISEYVRCGSTKDAALAAGYSESSALHNCYKILDQYGQYIAYMKELIAIEKAKILAIDSQTVLDEISRIGMANEFDYLIVEEKGGKKIARRKELHELTRDEMVAIKVVRLEGGKLAYDLHEKSPNLMALGKNLGLFNEKLIVERRNMSLKGKIDLSGVPTDQLIELIKSFEVTVSSSGKGRVLETQ